MSVLPLRCFLLLDIMLLFILQNHGCTGGKVFDENGLPVLGAKAVCDDLQAIGPVISDGTGVYKWPDGAVPEGPHTFTITKDGYEPVTLKAVVKYAPAPGHAAAEGLIFQIPDVKLHRVGARKAVAAGLDSPSVPATTVPRQPVTTRAESRPIEEPKAPPPKKDVLPTATAPPPTAAPVLTLPLLPPPRLGGLPPSTAPPLTVRTVPPPTVVISPFPTLPPLLPPTTTLPRTRLGGRPVPTTIPAQRQPEASKSLSAAIAPPGQQWYRSPDQKYSFSASGEWRVGFQGNQAILQYVEGNCDAMRIVIQVNNAGRPNAKVVQESTVVISGINAQVRSYEDGTIGYFFTCGEDRYSIFRSRSEVCPIGDAARLDQDALAVLTSFHCQ